MSKTHLEQLREQRADYEQQLANLSAPAVPDRQLVMTDTLIDATSLKASSSQIEALHLAIANVQEAIDHIGSRGDA